MTVETNTTHLQEIRKLAAVVCADVVGYSRLMQRDESGTHARIRELGAEVVGRHTDNRNGRLVKTMGDGFLLEFTSVSDAFAASVSVQEDMFERNKQFPDDAKGHLEKLHLT